MQPHELHRILHRYDLRPPRIVAIAITRECNLFCRHCWVEAGGAPPPLAMPERTVRRLIEEIKMLGGVGVRLTGGEPLCHPAWLRMLQYCRAVGIDELSLQTNATLFDRHASEIVRDLGFRRLTIQVSLDGALAATHDLVRGEGAFARALAGINHLAAARLAGTVSIFFTEMKHNLREFPELLLLAERLGIGAVISGTLVRRGRGADPAIEPPGPDEYLALVERYESDRRFREAYDRLGTVPAIEWYKGNAPRDEGCTFAEHPYITTDGTLYPCVLCPADGYAVSGILGRNLATSFAEAAPHWSALAAISRSRHREITACRDCVGRQFCGGGCMGRAVAACGNPLAADDRCAIRRLMYERSTRNSR